MCGIAGIASKTAQAPNLKEAVFGMSRAIAHRGPDGEGFAFFYGDTAQPLFSDHTPEANRQSSRFAFNPAQSIHDAAQPVMAFAHRRLSIIDLSEAGHQPMCDADARVWITFNGEIYNYIELRAELESKGYTFSTHTDTEVIIQAYRCWGYECLQHFNGMWAFAIYDAAKQQVFCARDRAGVKPFYYINSQQVFAFASEHKAFIKTGLINFSIDEANQFDFLVNAKLEHRTSSLFEGICELPPSHYLLYNIKSHSLQVTRYASLKEGTAHEGSEEELINGIRQTLVDAVKLRLRSDVEVGSCLSGGIDSSAIAGIVHHLQPAQRLKLFTSVFEGEAFDESAYAAKVSAFVHGDWHTVSPAAGDFFDDIAQLNYYQDLPIWSTSTYSQYRVMKLAREHGIKVVLDGQGADEIFSGYTHHYLSYWKELASGMRFGLLRREISASKDTLANPLNTLLKQYAKDLAGSAVSYQSYLPASSKSQPEKILTGLNRQLAHDYAGGRLKSYLKCEDRCSMAFGIESRVPFADDTELVNRLFSIPSSYKIKNGTLKYLLREAVKEFIPPVVYQRKDKVGFETPQVKWLKAGRSRIIDAATTLDIVNADSLVKDFDRLVETKPYFILRLYSFAVWKTVFSECQKYPLA